MGIWINETVFFFSVTIEGQRLAGATVVKFQELKFVILKLLIVLPMESYYVRCSAQGPVVNAGVSREDLCRLVHFVAYQTFVPLVGSATVHVVYPPISSQMRENFHIKRLKPLLDGVVISRHLWTWWRFSVKAE
ncbi:hypothetical protein FF2_005543 [Malus domestica]